MPSAPKRSEGRFWPDGARLTFRADDGLEIVGEVRGQDDTALIFLHGWCGDREYWKHQVEVFAADYRVVALDQAGHGESGKGRKAWTADGLAADVEAVVKALGLKRVILVGHSMGGSVALLAAKRMPVNCPRGVLRYHVRNSCSNCCDNSRNKNSRRPPR